MHYDAMQDEAGGGTRFVSYDLEQYPAEIETGVPPLLVTSPMSAGQVRFVDIPEDVKEVPPHPAPTRQFVVALTGVYEAVATDGSVRRIGPGELILAEDVNGGHVSRIIEHPARLMFVTLDPDGNVAPAS